MEPGTLAIFGSRVARFANANGEIVFDMEQYKHELEQIDVSKADKTKPERILNSKEHTQFRRGVGSLRWFVDHCCPQLSSQLAELRRKQSSSTVQDLLRLNKVIRTAKVIESKIKIRSIPAELLRFMGVHDAAHKNLEAGVSQQGHLILALHASITICRVPVSVPSWQSKKIKRVVRSSFGCRGKQYVDLSGASRLDAQWEELWHAVNLCSRIMSSSSRLVLAFLSPIARASTMQYTKKEQLQRLQTRDCLLNWP